MSKTWEVFAQSSEPEAPVKNARQTKNTKQDKLCELYIKQIFKIYIFIRILTSPGVYKNVKIGQITHKMFREMRAP